MNSNSILPKESSLKKFEQNLMNSFQYSLYTYLTNLLTLVNEVIKSFPCKI